ncbi:hypothetical protein NOM94_02420 [Acinetobacter baumannii]|nr:hypothetical protein [Acinetobacter baumannii]
MEQDFLDFIRRVIVLNEGQVVNIKIILKEDTMSILGFAIFFIISHVIGYFIAKTKWRIRHLAALFFISTFIIVWLGFLLLLYFKGRYVQFFVDGSISLNWRAVDLFFVAGMSSTLLTLLLVIVVWSIRNKVF